MGVVINPAGLFVGDFTLEGGPVMTLASQQRQKTLIPMSVALYLVSLQI